MTSSSSTDRSGRTTTKAFTASPECGWGTPITATSATAGCCAMTSSTSPGYTLKPETMIRSLVRSTMKRKPSSSTTATSPEIGRHTSELQSLMRISYAVFCLKKKIHTIEEIEATQH